MREITIQTESFGEVVARYDENLSGNISFTVQNNRKDQTVYTLPLEVVEAVGKEITTTRFLQEHFLQMQSPVTWDAPSPHEQMGGDNVESVEPPAYGIWSPSKEAWLIMDNDGTIYHTPNKRVAIAQLRSNRQIFDGQGDWVVAVIGVDGFPGKAEGWHVR